MSDQVADNAKSPHERAAEGVQNSLERMMGINPPNTPQRRQPVEDAVEVQADDGAEGEQSQTEGDGQEPTNAESNEALREVEIDGEVYQIPEKIAERFIHHADYTKKTQNLAELSRTLSAERDSLQVAQAFDKATAQERQQMMILDAQLAQFKNVDWSQMQTEDLLRTRAQFDQLRDARAEIAKGIDAKRGQFEQRINEARSQALQAGAKYIEQNIKGFDQNTQRALMDYGLSIGYQAPELANIVDPRNVVTMWKAMQWDALQASNPTVKNKAAKASPVIRPGATPNRPSQKQILRKRIADAKPGKEKNAAIEDSLAAGFFSGRG